MPSRLSESLDEISSLCNDLPNHSPHPGGLPSPTFQNQGGNELNSTIPSAVGAMESLVKLHLGDNELSGAIPSSVGNLSFLEFLYLGLDAYAQTDKGQQQPRGGNNLVSTIPRTMGALKSLRVLDLRYNKLSGEIPSVLFNLSRLARLDLSYNDLTGTAVSSDGIGLLVGLKELHLEGNDLSGPIGTGVCSLESLERLSLGNMYARRHCRISGQIPLELGDLGALKYFRAERCSLTGQIPSSLGKLTNMELFRLGDNYISGTIPPSLANMSALVDLLLSTNLLRGPLPSSIRKLRKLGSLHLAHNELNSTLPEKTALPPALKDLYLDDNMLTGTIKESIGWLTRLEWLGLADNKLDGEIPESLGNLRNIHRLSLERNNLRGTMPDSVCELQSYFGVSPSLSPEKPFSADCGKDAPKVACCCCKECCAYDVLCDIQRCPFNEPCCESSTTLDIPVMTTSSTLDPELSASAQQNSTNRSYCSWEKIFARDGRTSHQFGESVAVTGNTIIIGIPRDEVNGAWSGSVHVFNRVGDEWVQHASLVPSDGDQFNEFGTSVAVDGNTAIIGAGHHNSDSISDSAYVFVSSAGIWSEQARLMPEDGVDDWYGVSVAIDGITAVIGTPRNDIAGVRTGSAFVFRRVNGTWDHEATLAPQDGEEDDGFGSSVAVDGSTALIGAMWDYINGFESGSAYVYIREGGRWSQQAHLFPSNRTQSRNFGYSVALYSDTAMIGSPDLWDYDASFVYFFKRVGTRWHRRGKLLPPNDEADDSGFGSSVAVDSKTAVIGNFRDDKNGWLSGAAHVFSLSGGTWKLLFTLRPSEGEGYDWFGYSAAFSGKTVVVGSHNGDNNKGKDTGYAIVVELC